jgi:hypothetical protein
MWTESAEHAADLHHPLVDLCGAMSQPKIWAMCGSLNLPTTARNTAFVITVLAMMARGLTMEAGSALDTVFAEKLLQVFKMKTMSYPNITDIHILRFLATTCTATGQPDPGADAQWTDVGGQCVGCHRAAGAGRPQAQAHVSCRSHRDSSSGGW